MANQILSLLADSCLLEIGIFLSHIIWLVRTRRLRSEAAAQGKTFDDVAGEHEEGGIPFKFAERKSRKARARGEKDAEEGTAGVTGPEGTPVGEGDAGTGARSSADDGPDGGATSSGEEKPS